MQFLMDVNWQILFKPNEAMQTACLISGASLGHRPLGLQRGTTLQVRVPSRKGARAIPPGQDLPGQGCLPPFLC